MTDEIKKTLGQSRVSTDQVRAKTAVAGYMVNKESNRWSFENMAQGQGKKKKSSAAKKPQKKALGPKKGGKYINICCTTKINVFVTNWICCDGSNARSRLCDRVMSVRCSYIARFLVEYLAAEHLRKYSLVERNFFIEISLK